MPVTLRLFFFGLIAFVQSKNQLAVILLDATSLAATPTTCLDESVNQCPFHVHLPKLYTWLPIGACPDSTTVPGLCTWDLQKKLIEFPNGSAGLNYSGTRQRSGFLGSKHNLPFKVEEVSDFSWIPVMSDVTNVAGKFDIRALSLSDSRTTAITILASGSVQVCHIAELDSVEEPSVENTCTKNCVHVFSFRSLDGKAQEAPRQALGDGVMVSYNVPEEGGDHVTIKLNGQPIQLQPIDCFVDGLDSKCVDVAVTNMPGRADACPAVGLDFALLYQLSTLAPSPCSRVIPHRTTEDTSAKRPPNCNSPLVDQLSKSPEGSPDSRPVCPMVVYGG